MAGEPDQTKWVGIRPTDPPEPIPVAVVFDPVSIQVEPKPGMDPLPVLTQKKAPAVSDLQAIKSNTSGGISEAAQNIVVSRSFSSGNVGAGDIWIIENMIMWDNVSMCDMEMKARIGGVTRILASFQSYDKDCVAEWNGHLVLEEGDRLNFKWLKGGGVDNLFANWHGYITGVY